MTTKAVKDKRTAASQKRLEGLDEKIAKHEKAISELKEKRSKELQHLEWVQSMPVDDEGEDVVEEAPVS